MLYVSFELGLDLHCSSVEWVSVQGVSKGKNLATMKTSWLIKVLVRFPKFHFTKLSFRALTMLFFLIDYKTKTLFSGWNFRYCRNFRTDTSVFILIESHAKYHVKSSTLKFYLLGYPRLKSEIHRNAINPHYIHMKCCILLLLDRWIDKTKQIVEFYRRTVTDIRTSWTFTKCNILY